MVLHKKKGVYDMAGHRVQRDKLHSGYTEFLNYEEEQRLAVLDARAARQEMILKDTRAERRKIVMRAIRRSRRAEGKT